MKKVHVVKGNLQRSKCLKEALKAQAERCTPEHAELHIRRQRALGEQMVGDHDGARKWDLLATIAIVTLIVIGSMKGWW